MKKKIKILQNFSQIIENYSSFLIDLWGVIHNGVNIFPGENNVLKKIKEINKEVIFVTNAPRRIDVIKQQLFDFGLDDDLYNHVMSSGELTWLNINRKIKKEKRCLSCYHIGPDRDNHLMKNLKLSLVNDVSKADFILNTGPWGDNDILENYKNILNNGVKYDLDMICSNPDKRVIRGNDFMICAGLLAEYYESIKGKVVYFGKPYNEIYEECFKKLKQKEKKEILIIGDSMENDIKGANNMNIESLLITSGVHREVNINNNIDIDKLNDLMMENNVCPTYVIKELIL